MLTEIAEVLRKAESIILLSHINPDGDTLGCGAALKLALEKMGKHVRWMCDGEVPFIYSFLKGITSLEKPGASVREDVCVCLDISDKLRCGRASYAMENSTVTVNIDHHISNDKYAQFNHIGECSATGELILQLIDLLGVPLNTDIATALYVCLSTDTGSFCYSNTTPDTLHAAARLMSSGIDVSDITDKLYHCRTLAKTQLIGRAISYLVIEDDIAYIQLRESDFEELGADDSDSEGLVDYAKEIAGIEVAFLARETKMGTIKFSLRSNRRVDVCEIARTFNGGGHKRAAGCTLKGSMQSAVERVLDRIKERSSGA